MFALCTPPLTHGTCRASWQRQTSKSKSLSEAEVRERPSKDPAIVCSIDNRIFRDAVKTPCCGTAYCEDCIQTYLLEKDFICPSCASKVASLDKLAIDKPTRTRVADYITREIEASQKEEDTSEFTPVGSVSQVTIPDTFFLSLHVYCLLYTWTRRHPRRTTFSYTHKRTFRQTWQCLR
jgi:hypothetical protein